MREFNNDLLIDQATGEVDVGFVRRSAVARARSQYGAGCTDLDIRHWTEKLTTMASMLRVKRRRELGLPDEDAIPFNEGGTDRKIILTHSFPPIPVRNLDWQAHFDGDEPDDDGRMQVGHGATEAEAIRDLIDNYEAA